MKTAIATVCLSGGLREKLAAIAVAGFRAVEIFENDLLAFPGTPAEIRTICADLGLEIITYQPFRDFEGMPDSRRAKGFDRAARKFDLMSALGCDLILVCSNTSPDSLGGLDRAAADFAELGELAAGYGIRVGFEALAWARHIHDYRDAWEVVRRANHPNIGTILDSFHILARGTELNTLRTIPKESIFLVQVADAPILQMDYLSWSRHWRCMPGQGEMDINSFMDALQDTGFDGHLSLEIFNDRFRAGSARTVAVDGHRSLIGMIDDAGRRRSPPVATRMPPRSAVEGVEFIEFAVDEAGLSDFEHTLRALGFVLSGRHRSKDVTLWQQGTIRLVVNSDKEGFAHSYQMTHGTSVCALALRVNDAAATNARATALLETPYVGGVGQGELAIPALRGLGGSLIYFVDNVSGLGRWAEVDFRPVHAEPSTVGLTGIDHISQSMQYEEMLTWQLFYTSLLETRKTSAQAVMDPGGVVQSQVIESGPGGDGGLRLVLNGSQSSQTLANRFINEFFGSGVQHIALATPDIVAAVSQLVANGQEMLPIPQNYYDDLAARTDIPPARLADLQRLNIMYDQDAGGSFHQAYTRTMAGGFFFEIIQREGYTGYGAANAVIRLSAQSRMADGGDLAL